MIAKPSEPLANLYEADETAWLDAMSELVVAGCFDDLDYVHLGEYLADMAKRDRREVSNRLAILIAHVLKWIYQSSKQTKSWRRTIVVQRQRLERLLESGSLRNHAVAVLGEAYSEAVEQAMAETGLPAATFPPECPWTLDQLLSEEMFDK